LKKPKLLLFGWFSFFKTIGHILICPQMGGGIKYLVFLLVKVPYNASLFLSFELFVVGRLLSFPTMHTTFDSLCQVSL